MAEKRAQSGPRVRGFDPSWLGGSSVCPGSAEARSCSPEQAKDALFSSFLLGPLQSSRLDTGDLALS